MTDDEMLKGLKEVEGFLSSCPEIKHAVETAKYYRMCIQDCDDLVSSYMDKLSEEREINLALYYELEKLKKEASNGYQAKDR